MKEELGIRGTWAAPGGPNPFPPTMSMLMAPPFSMNPELFKANLLSLPVVHGPGGGLPIAPKLEKSDDQGCNVIITCENLKGFQKKKKQAREKQRRSRVNIQLQSLAARLQLVEGDKRRKSGRVDKATILNTAISTIQQLLSDNLCLRTQNQEIQSLVEKAKASTTPCVFSVQVLSAALEDTTLAMSAKEQYKLWDYGLQYERSAPSSPRVAAMTAPTPSNPGTSSAATSLVALTQAVFGGHESVADPKSKGPAVWHPQAEYHATQSGQPHHLHHSWNPYYAPSYPLGLSSFPHPVVSPPPRYYHPHTLVDPQLYNNPSYPPYGYPVYHTPVNISMNHPDRAAPPAFFHSPSPTTCTMGSERNAALVLSAMPVIDRGHREEEGCSIKRKRGERDSYQENNTSSDNDS